MADEPKIPKFDPAFAGAGTANLKWEDTQNAYAKAFEVWLTGYKQDEQYLTELANTTTRSQPKHFLNVRSIVLDTHIHLDYAISSIIGFMLMYMGEYKGNKYSGRDTQGMIDYIHEKVYYSTRLKMVENLKILSKESLEILEELNLIRVAFAHGKKNGKYNYFNDSIFEKTTIMKLLSDKKK